MCEHSNESYCTVTSGGTVYEVCGGNPSVDKHFHLVLYFSLCKVVVTSWFVDEVLSDN